MPTESDLKMLLRHFTDELSAYNRLDPEWVYPARHDVKVAWDRVRDVARRLLGELGVSHLDDKEVDEVLGWEYD